MASAKSGTLFVTTLPMPTIAQRPMSIPPPMVQFAPTVAPHRTVVFCVLSSGSLGSSADRSGVAARGNLSLVNTVAAATITPSSSVTPAHTYT